MFPLFIAFGKIFQPGWSSAQNHSGPWLPYFTHIYEPLGVLLFISAARCWQAPPGSPEKACPAKYCFKDFF